MAELPHRIILHALGNILIAFLNPITYISLKKADTGTLHGDMHLKMMFHDFFFPLSTLM